MEVSHNGLHLNHGWVSQWCLWSGRSKRGALWLTFWDWRIGRFCEFHGSGSPWEYKVLSTIPALAVGRQGTRRLALDGEGIPYAVCAV